MLPYLHVLLCVPFPVCARAGVGLCYLHVRVWCGLCMCAHVCACVHVRVGCECERRVRVYLLGLYLWGSGGVLRRVGVRYCLHVLLRVPFLMCACARVGL